MNKWRTVRYDRYVTCAGCGMRVDYNAERGGRPPKYCDGCRDEVKREQAKGRVAAMRWRRGAAWTKTIDDLLADAHEMHGRAERMQRESQRIMAQHGRHAPAWIVDYATEVERSWGWFLERSHNLAAQLEREWEQ